MSARLSLVVARARNGVIGREGALPWRLAGDMAHFRQATMGKPVLMGRKTWDSFPKRPLPGRANLVLTRDAGFRAAGGWTFSDFPAALAAARAMTAEEVCVIGGAALYALALPLADRLYITEVDATPDGDAHFPDFDEAAFREIAREDFPADAKNDHAFALRTLARR
ncbi:MAG: dihydrofolate reductase [Hyphomonadaceae bacterium]